MKLICCIEKKGGMLFGGRRVSRDSVVTEKILSLICGEEIYMTSASASLFPQGENIIITEDFSQAKGKYCFVEDPKFIPEEPNQVFLFLWNRDYPADAFFPLNLKETGYKKKKKEEFGGNSHKKITLEHYEK